MWTASNTRSNPHGGFELRSVMGVQQGDPLRSLLSAHALQSTIDRIRRKVFAATRHYQGALAKPCMMAFYLDGGVPVADHRILADVAHYLSTEEPLSHGVHLKLSGTKVCLPTLPPPRSSENNANNQRSRSLELLYPENIQIHRGHGIILHGSPIGSEELAMRTRGHQVKEIAQTLLMLTELNDAHVTFTLLRACFSGTKINALLRTVLPLLTATTATLYDKNVAAVVRNLANGRLSEETFAEMQFPLRIDDKQHPQFGVGLTSAARTASAAYLASVAGAIVVAQSFVVHAGMIYDDTRQRQTRKRRQQQQQLLQQNQAEHDTGFDNHNRIGGINISRNDEHKGGNESGPSRNDGDSDDGGGDDGVNANIGGVRTARLFGPTNKFAENALEMLRSHTYAQTETRHATPTLNEIFLSAMRVVTTQTHVAHPSRPNTRLVTRRIRSNQSWNTCAHINNLTNICPSAIGNRNRNRSHSFQSYDNSNKNKHESFATSNESFSASAGAPRC